MIPINPLEPIIEEITEYLESTHTSIGLLFRMGPSRGLVRMYFPRLDPPFPYVSIFCCPDDGVGILSSALTFFRFGDGERPISGFSTAFRVSRTSLALFRLEIEMYHRLKSTDLPKGSLYKKFQTSL